MTDMVEFDVVVVGAGSAGCVLAARLSEDPDRRVGGRVGSCVLYPTMLGPPQPRAW